MKKVTTKEAFFLAYCEAYPCDNILKIAEEINYQQAQEIMAQGLADHMGTRTEEDKAVFGIFGEDNGKAEELLDIAISDTHGRLEEMVAKDYIRKLSMDEAITLIRLLKKSPNAEFTFGGVTIRENYIVSRWSNTHRSEKEEFMSKLEGK